MKGYAVQKIGEHKGAPRFYKEGRRIALAGFAPGVHYSATLKQEQGMLLLKVDPAGGYKVSKKTARTSEAVEIPFDFT